MQLNASQKRLVQRVINVFETGTPDGDYGNISIYHDGPHDVRQITYGRSQTTEYGNLRELVADYVAANGLFSSALSSYANRIGTVPLTDDTTFKNLLRRAGREDPIMRSTQDRFFDKRYYTPAIKWATDNGFTLPLSALVIYDSFIHSGRILWPIREMFAESAPAAGGREKVWTSEYVKARHKWLSAHHRPPVRLTVYRMKCFRREIDRNNWDLTQVPINANGTNVT
jgi:chitosanase